MGESHIKNSSTNGDFAGAEHLIDKSQITQQITTFTEDTEVTTDDQFTKTPIPNPYPTESIKEWLCRPYPIRHVKWSKNDETGKLLAYATFPQDLFTIQQLWDKVSNFHYFRANVKISIRMNGTKTHYGKIIAMWSPYPDFDSTYSERTSNIYAVSGFPHVIVSPTENEVNELTIPFISPLTYSFLDPTSYSLGDFQKFNFGSLYVFVLNNLQNMTGANTDVSFSVFANFEDIELAGYTTTKLIKPFPSTPPLITQSVSPVINQFRAQAKRLPRPTPIKEAQAKSNKGVVGSTLEQIGNVAAKLTSIPIINNVASIVSPVAYSLSSIANLFGWTKPDTLEATKPCVLRYIDTTQTHGLDTATKLALLPDNSVGSGICHMGASPRMDFESICATPMLLTIALWRNDDSEGTDLFSFPVNPGVSHSEEVNDTIRVHTTYLAHVARSFKYWRGDLRYYIQVTSSAFHSGRLRIWYEANDTSTPINVIDGSNVVSKVIDIQTETDISFTIPYLANTPYKNFVYSNPSRSGSGTITPIGEAGRIGVQVLNELTSSSTPVQPVYINVWISGVNMQFGAPVTPSFDTFEETPFDANLVAQGITQEQITKLPYDPLIQATTSREELLCMGEQPDHVKDLIMRPCPLIYYNTGVAVNTPGAVLTRRAYYERSSYQNITGYINGGLPAGYYKFTTWGSFKGYAKLSLGLNTYDSTTGAVEFFALGKFHDDLIKYPMWEGYVLTTRDYSFFTVDVGTTPINDVFINVHFDLVTGQGPDTSQDLIQNKTPPLNPDVGGKDVRIRIDNPFLTSYTVPKSPHLMKRPTYLSYFASIFRFWRGSVRYKLFEVRGTNVSTRSAHLDHYPPPTSDAVSYDLRTTYTRGFAEGLTSVRDPVSNALEITVPYYYNTGCRIHTSDPAYRDPVTPVFDIIQNKSEAPFEAEGYVLASAGDDFEFGFLVPPPFYIKPKD